MAERRAGRCGGAGADAGDGGGGLGRSRRSPAENAIREALTEWRLAFNARDTGAVCGLFAPELRYDIRGFPERGFEEVCGQLLGSLADQNRKYAYDVTIKEIIVSGDLAAVRLVWTFTVKRPGQVGGTATTEPGLDLFRRQGDGTWKIVRYLALTRSSSQRETLGACCAATMTVDASRWPPISRARHPPHAAGMRRGEARAQPSNSIAYRRSMVQ